MYEMRQPTPKEMCVCTRTAGSEILESSGGRSVCLLLYDSVPGGDHLRDVHPMEPGEERGELQFSGSLIVFFFFLF